MPVVDRWYRRDKATGKKVRSDRYGVGLRWMVQWETESGRRQSKSFATRDEAEKNYAAIKADLYRGVYIDPELGKITLQEYAEQWLASRDHAALSAEGTRGRLEKHVYPHLGHIPLRKIRPTTIQTWTKGLAATKSEHDRSKAGEPPRMLAGTTRERIFANVASILQAAVDDGIIARNPAKVGTVIKPKKDTKAAIPWSRERIIAVERNLPDRWKPIIALGTGQGLRRGEMFGLDPEADIDWLAREVHVRRQVLVLAGNRLVFSLPKYEKTRVVPLSPYVAAQLSAYIQKYPPREVTLPWKHADGPPVTAKLLFTSREGKATNGNYVGQKVWRPACRAAGFEPTNRDGFHVLRHTYASVLLDAGESIVTVAEHLGHADPSFTLKTYGHLMPDSADRSRAAIDAFMRGDADDAAPGAEGATGSQG